MFKKINLIIVVVAILLTGTLTAGNVFAGSASADEVMTLLTQGNARFVAGKPQHPNTGGDRLADTAGNGQHPFATVITCSDSRVPVERIFDRGIGDIFVIRVAGNVCNTDEIGSIEYGTEHLGTDVLVVLGHAECGAVKAVAANAELHGNIAKLTGNIKPAVEKAHKEYPQLEGKEFVDKAIRANVWQSIEDLYRQSQGTKEKVKSGKLQVVGAVYDISTGKVEWLGAHPQQSALLTSTGSAIAGADSHGAASQNTEHGAAAATAGHDSSVHAATQVQIAKVTLVEPSKLQELDKARHRKAEVAESNLSLSAAGMNILWKIGLTVLVIAIIAGIVFQSGFLSRLGISGKLYAGFGSIVMLAAIIGLGGYYFLQNVTTKSRLESVAIEMDMRTDEISMLQNEFLLYGIEDKQRGEECVKEVIKLTDGYKTGITNIRELGIDQADQTVLGDIEKAVSTYKTTFDELADNFHAIEADKEKLDEFGKTVDEKLAEIIRQHQAELAKMERNGSDAASLTQQTELVEKLSECELLCTRIEKEEVEFLIDKRIERIGTMEHDLGLCYGQLTAIKSILSEAGNKNGQNNDTAILNELANSLHAYQNVLAEVVVAELVVASDVIDTATSLNAIGAMTMGLAKKAGQQAAIVTNQANMASITLIIIAVVLGSLLAFVIARAITKPIGRIISGLTEGSEQVSSASQQVSAASQSLAEGATEQAAGLEETSSSLEEMSSMTKQNAENAQQAATLAGEARNAASNGNQAMGKMNDAIKQIQKSSDETAKIIKVIDEIAFQTNLLALNAAVEAARAGEAGKGFAVVAEEVRNLAMRSAEAAKNTSAMIEESVKNSKNGVDISNEVAKVLGEIVGAASKTADLIGEIAASSQEQAKGIDQVNVAVAQMDKVTQSNAANAEESASASEELSAQATTMNDIVNELVALVSGAAAKNQTVGRSATGKVKGGRKDLSLADHTFHHIADNKGKATKSHTAVRVSAEKLIPLHNDDQHDDLKKFNS